MHSHPNGMHTLIYASTHLLMHPHTYISMHAHTYSLMHAHAYSVMHPHTGQLIVKGIMSTHLSSHSCRTQMLGGNRLSIEVLCIYTPNVCVCTHLLMHTLTHAHTLFFAGYYARVVAIRTAVREFLEASTGEQVQIVNLGAGLDPLYFWILVSLCLCIHTLKCVHPHSVHAHTQVWGCTLCGCTVVCMHTGVCLECRTLYGLTVKMHGTVSDT